MYSFPNFELVHCCSSNSNCCFLTCIQVSQEAGKMVWYSYLFKNFPVCCNPHSQRLQRSQWSRSRFLGKSLAFPMIQWMLAIWSLAPLLFLNPACTSGSCQFMYCWSLAWRILSTTLLVCEVSAVVHSLALPFFGIGRRTDLFQTCGHWWVSKFADMLSAVF